MVLRGGEFDRLRKSSDGNDNIDAGSDHNDVVANDIVDIEAEDDFSAGIGSDDTSLDPPEIEAQIAKLAEAVNQKAPPGILSEPGGSAKIQARIKGYEGDACPDCGQFTLVRNGACLRCDSCGSSTGCS